MQNKHLVPVAALRLRSLARFLFGLLLAATATAATYPRLALQYWRAGDFPGFADGGYVSVWVDGFWNRNLDTNNDLQSTWYSRGAPFIDLYNPDGGYDSTVPDFYTPNWFWVDGHYELQWRGDANVYPNGKFGPQWSTLTGTFNIGDASSTYNPSSTNRDYLIYPCATFTQIAVNAWGSAPDNNCSSYRLNVYAPSGSVIGSYSFSSNSGMQWVSVNQTGPVKLELTFLNATGVPQSSGTVTYYIYGGGSWQSINFPFIPRHAFGDAAFSPNATASSGLPVEYTVVSGPAVINANKIAITGDGTVTVRAVQPGGFLNGVAWTPAPSVEQTFTVSGAPQTISFPAIPSHVYADAPFALAATASSGLPITYSLAVAGPASVSGNIVTILGAGSVTIRAEQAGNYLYAPAPTVQQTFTIAKANQSISFGPFGNRVFGDVLPMSATASSGLPVNIQLVSGPATLSGGKLTITGVGTITLTATQAGNGNYNPAPTITQSFAALADSTPPAAPTALAVYNVTGSSVQLSWLPAADNSNNLSYEVYRNGTLVTTVTGTTALVQGLSASTTYQFTVRARDPSGNVSAQSGLATGRTWQRLYASSGTVYSTDNYDENGNYTGTTGSEDWHFVWLSASGVIRSYTTGTTDTYGRVYSPVFTTESDSGGDGSNFCILNTVSTNPYNWFYVTVKGHDEFVTGDYQVYVDFLGSDTTAPSSPTNARADVAASSLTFRWDPAFDDVAVTGYEVMRNGVSLGTIDSTWIACNGLTPATTYALQVRARDAAGNWSAWSAINATTAVDTTAPTKPSGLYASNITPTSYTLSWTPSTDDVGVTAYEVQANGAVIATVTTPTFDVTGIALGMNYPIAIRAKDAANNYSLWSTTFGGTIYQVTVQDGTPSVAYVVAGSSVTIHANPPAGQYFTGWTASGPGTFARSNAFSTEFTAGSGNVALQAASQPGAKLVIPDDCIVSGYGGTEGKTITITAPPAPAGSVFAGWSASWGFCIIPNPCYTTTTIKMSRDDVSLRPVYVSASGPKPLWSQISEIPYGLGTSTTPGKIGIHENLMLTAVGLSANGPLTYQTIEYSMDYGRTWQPLVAPGLGSINSYPPYYWMSWWVPTVPAPQSLGRCIIRTTARDAYSVSMAAYTSVDVVDFDTIIPPATITQQPRNVSAVIGGHASLTVAISGPAPYNTFTYQWRKDNVAIPGATGATFTIDAVQQSDVASYSVVMGDGRYSYISASAALKIEAALPVLITQQPTSVAVQPGEIARFAVGAVGVPSPSYQWTKNSEAIPGANDSTLTIPSVQAADQATYAVRIWNEVSAPVASDSVVLVMSTNYHPQPDADNDGIPDAWETAHGLNPNSAADALQDADGDGFSNLAEYVRGSDPFQAEANFGAGIGNSMTASWPSKDLTKSEAVGSTSGALSVDAAGAAAYSIPIYTPPGIAGIQPSLALQYSSNGPNGLLGVGWSLSGLSVITRGASSDKLYSNDDPFSGPANFDNLDRFFMDGNRLKLVSGAKYGDSESEYRTAIETFNKIVFHSDHGSWFEVWTKSGLRLEYGKTADSRGGGSTRAGAWLLDRVEDRSGNYYTVSYSGLTGGVSHYPYPYEIKYTGTSNQSTFITIRFAYKEELRLDRLQLRQPTVGDVDILHTVDAIDIIWTGQANAETRIRRYAFEYETSVYTGRSRLKSVQEAGLNDSKLPKTTFHWKEGGYGFTNVALNALQSSDDLIYVGDFTGDGKADYLRIGALPTRNAQLFTSTGDTFTPGPVFALNPDSSFNAIQDNIQVGDFDGDGLSDVVISIIKNDSSTQSSIRDSIWKATPSASNGFTQRVFGEKTVTRSPPDSEFNIPDDIIVDPGQRGRACLLSVPSDGKWQILEYSDDLPGFQLINRNYPIGYLKKGNDVRLVDLTGEGSMGFFRGDVSDTTSGSLQWRSVALWHYGNAYWWWDLGTNFNSKDYKLHLGDFNGDGLSDVVALKSTSGGSRKIYTRNNFSAGADISDAQSADWYDQSIVVCDMNQDGRDDLLVQRGSECQVWVSSYDVANPVGFTKSYTIPGGPLKNERAIPFDMDGDGRLDFFVRGDKAAGNSSTACRVLRATGSGAPADVIDKIVGGFGTWSEIEYANITDSSVYTKGESATGMTNIKVPINVVKQLTFDLGTASSVPNSSNVFTETDASYSLTFKYEGLRAAPYRGLLGFAAQEVTDSRTGVITRVEKRQDYPYIGFATRTKVYRKVPGGDVVLSDTSTVPGRLTLNGGATDYIYPQSVLAETWGGNTPESWDVSRPFTWQGPKTSSIAMSQSVDNYGNVTEADIDYGFEGRAVTTTALYWPADTDQWLVGRLKKLTVVAQATGHSTDTRVTDVYYKDNDDQTNEDISPLLVTKTESEATDPEKKLTIVYGYTDGTGHVNKVTVSGRKNQTTDQTRSVEYVYEPLMRFVREVKHTAPTAAGGILTETIEPDHVHGGAASYTDINNQTTSFWYDDFCRLNKVAGPDNVTTESTLAWTTDPRGVYSIETNSTYTDNGTSKPASSPTFAVFDRLGRLTRTAVVSADGHPVWRDVRYDSRGYATYTSQPYRQLPASTDWSMAPDYVGGKPMIFWESIGRDTLGRVEADVLPNGSIVTFSYYGLEVKSVARDGHLPRLLTRTVHDAMGRVSELYHNENVSLPSEKDTLKYVYNASGRLEKVTASGIDTSMTYDNRGLRLSITDPNSGTQSAKFNAFGELYETTDAKLQTIAYDRDILGRLTSSVAPEGTTTWTYDTAPGKGKGALYQVTSPDAGGGTFTETLEYDPSFSRLSKVKRQIAGQEFTVTPGYDSASRMTTVQYDSPDLTEKLKYAYNGLGAMREIRDMSAGPANGLIVWALGEENAFGQPLAEELGNGIQVSSLYSLTDGRLRQRTVSGGSVYKASAFDVDGFGNVFRRRVERMVHTGNVLSINHTTELYRTDSLSRLTTVSSSGGAGFALQTDYDLQGNIVYKSDVGDYLYQDAARPHAVTKAGTTTFAYDANGNRTHRNGVQEAWWTSFNQPSKLKRGTSETTFRYDDTGMRTQSASSDGTVTRYIDGLHEYVTKSGANQGRFAVVSGSGQVAQITVGSGRDYRYLSGDHLGSVETITDVSGRELLDSSGNNAMEMGYTAWGQRRSGSTLAPGMSPADANVTGGFTGQEMLDDLQLINMNGRVYDPVVARFLSVDPIVAFPGMPQAFNGYSYVLNNPLSFTDPSGYEPVASGSFYSGGGYNFAGVNFNNASYSATTYSAGWSASGGASVSFSFSPLMTAGSAGGVAAAAQPGLRYLAPANGGALGYSIAGFGTGLAPSSGTYGAGDGPPIFNAERDAEEFAMARMRELQRQLSLEYYSMLMVYGDQIGNRGIVRAGANGTLAMLKGSPGFIAADIIAGLGAGPAGALERRAAKIMTTGVLDVLDPLVARQVATIIAENPVGSATYRQLQKAGIDLTLDFKSAPGAGSVVKAGEGGADGATVFMRNHSSAQEAASTAVHEGRHAVMASRGINQGTQWAEFMARAREFMFKAGRVPTAAERSQIWQEILKYPEYQNLPFR